ncbi:MAG: inositol 2-dehydrogenase [Actinomycetota bacterium]|jgi:myo-inositol 2-dehydrogenase/D-chiro-inositol 1-dehydrogenase|nr:inositol 2-dehydrogenase [Actinomycetota bacterium]
MTVRIGILGCGRIGRMHAELLSQRVPGAELAGVYDVIPAAARAVAEQFGVAATASVDELITADGIDAVAICTSTESHVDMIVAAAGAGLGVFCEKPIALDLKLVDDALAEVERTGVGLHVGFNRRFDPAHRAVHDAVAGGKIGELHLLRITSRDPAPPPLGYIATSGGLFLDMTIHDFDMARFVTGSEVVEVSAAGAARIDPAIAEAGDIDTAAITLSHADGCLTVIDNSRRAVYGYDQRLEAFGSEGLVASENAPAHGAVRHDAAGTHVPPIANFFLDRYTASFVLQWEAFVGCVAERRPPPVTGSDGRATLVIGLAAKRSFAEHRSVAVSEIDP